MTDKKISIALVQHAYKDSLEYIENNIKKAADQGAAIICLQELFSTPYFCRTIDPAHFDLAETFPGKLTRFFSALAKKYEVVLIVPFFEKRLKGLYHNSAFVVDADGSLLGIYRKQHIPDDPSFYEKYYFSPGDEGYKVFKTKYGTISVLICWDQWFPEAARTVALMGAEILFYPTAIGILNGEESCESKYMRAWKTIQQSHAIANGIYVASVNRVGQEGEIQFWGNSFVCDPFGEIISPASEKKETLILTEIDFDLITEVRHTWPFLRDRRTDTYPVLLRKAVP